MKTIQKTVSLFLTILVFVLCLSACGGAGVEHGGTDVGSSGVVASEVVASSEATASSEAAGSSDNIDSGSGESDLPKGISMDDLVWVAEGGIWEGNRFLLLSLENRSPYTVLNFKITFQEKSGLSEEQKTEYFTDMKEELRIDENDPDSMDLFVRMKKEKITISGEIKQLLHTGESAEAVRCIYPNRYDYVQKGYQIELVDPDIATVRYLDGDQICTVYYDFANKKYTKENKTIPAVSWAVKGAKDMLPQPEAEVILVDDDSNDSFSCDIYGQTEEQYIAYVEACKAAGFNKYLIEYDDYFSADNADGNDLTVSYDAGSRIVGVMLWIY